MEVDLKRKTINIQGVKDSFSYDEETGEIRRIKFRGANCNRPIFQKAKKSRYPVVGFEGKSHPAHVIAWVIKMGYCPELDIDHINGDKWDNRWTNLREASRSQNCQNKPICKTNKSGIKGICWHKKANKWYAQLKVNGKHVFRSVFNSIEDAANELKIQRAIHHKEFSNNGKFD